MKRSYRNRYCSKYIRTLVRVAMFSCYYFLICLVFTQSRCHFYHLTYFAYFHRHASTDKQHETVMYKVVHCARTATYDYTTHGGKVPTADFVTYSWRLNKLSHLDANDRPNIVYRSCFFLLQNRRKETCMLNETCSAFIFLSSSSIDMLELK